MTSDYIPYRVGKLHNRRKDIHDRFAGQRQSGIVTPKNHPYVFLFTGETGGQYGYADQWVSDVLFTYTGDGQSGDMQFIRGNRAIRDHRKNSRELLLFESQKTKGMYKFLGQVDCAGWEYGKSVDKNGAKRRSIVFHLVLTDAPEVHIDEEDDDFEKKPLAELRKLALEAANPGPTTPSKSQRNYFKRSNAVAIYVLRRANGRCESCKKDAPFKRKNGDPYLEPHHLNRIADGGPDHPEHVGAICPNCHREIHHGGGGKELNRKLAGYVAGLERD